MDFRCIQPLLTESLVLMILPFGLFLTNRNRSDINRHACRVSGLNRSLLDSLLDRALIETAFWFEFARLALLASQLVVVFPLAFGLCAITAQRTVMIIAVVLVFLFLAVFTFRGEHPVRFVFRCTIQRARAFGFLWGVRAAVLSADNTFHLFHR